MVKNRKNEIILGALMVAIAYALWVNLGGGGQTAGPGGGAPPGGAAPRVDIGKIQLPSVNWAALTAPRPSYDPSGRNIFTWGVIVPPPPPPMSPEEKAALEKAQAEAAAARKAAEEAAAKAAAEQQQKALEQVQQQAQLQANLPPPKPVPPPINYKFIGYFGPSENKIAILNDGTDMIFVRQGEKVGGQFKILEIGYESVKFGYTDPKFRGETTTVPMSSSP
jgi:hypothetical protein